MTVPPPSRRPTLADIAARARTTVPTVSKVLNGRSDVSAETRRRVMDLVAETGYRRRGTGPLPPVSGARRLVDLVIPQLSGGWAHQVLIGVESAAAAAGYDLVVTVAEGPAADPADRHRRVRTQNPGGRQDWVTRLLSGPSQGAVLALVDATTDELATLRAAAIPVVLLDPVRPPLGDTASVGTTNWTAGRDVAEHLLQLGHRRLGVLAHHPQQLYSRARVDGFTSAVLSTTDLLGSADQPGRTTAPRPEDIDVRYLQQPPNSQPGTPPRHLTDLQRSTGLRGSADLQGPTGLRRSADLRGSTTAAEAAGSMLDQDCPPTAIFACSDALAFAVLEAAAARGVAVPDQLSVVGFDDLPESARLGLTTVRQPIAAMGAAALRMLLRLQTADRELPREELATTLIVRETTAPPLTRDRHAARRDRRVPGTDGDPRSPISP